ncbi:Na(+)-translocating NADH-quinone reductase subunit C [Pseudomonas berkeleyensis]|uniref:Na(+)-translocating NADH-quinone reductase subunit C n=1 Tax=Pseudomonas berkeleyensis TaxID=2726956 RepID=A0A7G5DJ06_9PSED|nr:Na(+)-translocating NADH-quinone reductase subunit C [Pseudomonas berkeleyensis]QMV61731.1 Na(+)-translocating NADH-quinone reductase subunit C [Pseudomonas berkeleyensis]WSO37164.1 Na(+)-translocating NADH-quinone reductase subunit C [Pseudomonas berkeleyensis]
MSKIKETPVRTLVVALVMCLVCSIAVSAAALILRPAQQENALVDRQRAVLEIAGLWQPGMSNDEIREVFSAKVTPRLVDMRSGQFSDAHDPHTFDQNKASKEPGLSSTIPAARDIASIRRLEHYAVVYVIEHDGQMDRLILPVRGYGLWSTMYGFVALQPDLDTVAGLGFYQHGETPGLGGEIDNPNWQAKWVGKKVYDDGEAALRVIKGSVNPENPQADYQVDAIAGATLTGNGVTHMIQFWLGEDGFGPFLKKLAAGEA